MTNGKVIVELSLETAEALIKELLPTTGRIWTAFRDGRDPEEWVFRGQRNADWGLQPSAFRQNAFAKFGNVDIGPLQPYGWMDDTRLEHHHVMRFVTLADMLGFHIPGDRADLRDQRAARAPVLDDEFPPTDYVYMYALAQHYKVPTRLLDWTYRPLFAAYFAARGDAPTDGTTRMAVWALHRTLIVQRLGYNRPKRQPRDPYVTFVTPPSSTNPNLAAQAGTFSLVYDPPNAPVDVSKPYVPHRIRDLDRLVSDCSDLFDAGAPPPIMKFTLPETERGRLFRLLAAHRVHAGTVYPGLQGVVDALCEERDHA